MRKISQAAKTDARAKGRPDLHTKPSPPVAVSTTAVKPPLRSEATWLFEALYYQLLVAIEHCHELEDDQCVWIEVQGDVTTSDEKQTEVKNYSDSLTDNHLNFWNTIRNWLDKNFDRTAYKRLELLTTQEFGAKSLLTPWNTLNASARFAIMENIVANANAKARVKKAGIKDSDNSDSATEGDGSEKRSTVRALQQYVMAAERRAALNEILERMHIITGAKSLDQLVHSYKTRYLKSILPSNHERYLQDLMGFVWNIDLMKNGWQITHKDFSDKLAELNRLYMKHSGLFPLIDSAALNAKVDIQAIQKMPFAKKILEIDGEKYLERAALHRQITEETISEFIKNGIPYQAELRLYRSNHLAMHKEGRESALLDCEKSDNHEKLQLRSKKFYLDRIKMPADRFGSMEGTRPEFRNGVYHMLADEIPKDPKDEFHWKLWE